MSVPNLVPKGWATSDNLGGGDALLEYPDGTVRFAHLCDRDERGIVLCAPALQINNGHTLTRDDVTRRPTVRASILCGDCDAHGFITDGRWEAC